MRRRGIKEAGERGRMRFASHVSSIRSRHGWNAVIPVGVWTRRLYRQRLVPISHFGWRGKMMVGWALAPVAGRRHFDRILIGAV